MSKSVPIFSLDEMNDTVNTIFYINFLIFFVSSKMTCITWIQKTLFLRLNCSLCVFSFMKSFYFIFFKLEILKRVSFVFRRCFLRNGNEVESCILALVVDNLY